MSREGLGEKVGAGEEGRGMKDTEEEILEQSERKIS